MIPDVHEAPPEHVSLDTLDRAQVDDGPAMYLGELSWIETFKELLQRSADQMSLVRGHDFGVFLRRLEVENRFHRNESGGIGESGGDPGEIFGLRARQCRDQLAHVEARTGLPL